MSKLLDLIKEYLFGEDVELTDVKSGVGVQFQGKTTVITDERQIETLGKVVKGKKLNV